MSKQSQTLYKITVTAVFLALGVVVSLLASFDIPVLGESGIKVGFAGVFTSFPALLFGPWYGGAASALADFFRAIIKPTGAFNPLFTLTAFLGGFLRGLIFSCLRNKKALAVKIGTYAVGLVSIAAGIINRFLLHADGISPALFDGMEPAAVDVGKFSLIGRLIVSRAAITKNAAANLSSYIIYCTSALILFGALLLAAAIINDLVSLRRPDSPQRNTGIKITLALVLSGLIQTTVNTVILREMIYASWRQLGFFAVWVPRAIEEVVVRVIQAWLVSLLYEIYCSRLRPLPVQNGDTHSENSGE